VVQWVTFIHIEQENSGKRSGDHLCEGDLSGPESK